jgi:hypothetical protein
VVLHLAAPAELVDEVHVPGGAAELAVRGRAQAHLLLHAHDLADGVVLDGVQLLVVELAVGVRRARVEQPLRAQQAADVVGAERWRVPQAHTITS